MIKVEEQTNVAELRAGENSAKNVGNEIGRFVVTTMKIPWQVSKDKLGGRPEAVIMVENMEEAWLEEMVALLPECDAVVGIGGGQAVDAAKYVSWKKGIRLISIPTILSVDAFVTPAAGIRRNHQVAYVGNTTPNPLIIDFEILRTAPPELNIAGIGDLLSMHTATFDLSIIAETFKLERSGKCEYLEKWLNQSYGFTEYEQKLFVEVHTEMVESSDYLNEEEIKIRLIAPLFQIANIDEENKVRSLSVEIEDFQLSVICDCMVASSTIFKTPTHPYFFLQEFKKAKGEKRDPEAQMLVAMLAAQKANNDGQTIYGGFLIGSIWRLATLVNNTYCTSRQFSATNKEDLKQLVSALRHLKALILNV